MSTRLCLFGVSPATDESVIVRAVKDVFRTYEPLESAVYVAVQSSSAAKARRYFYLLAAKSFSWTFESMSSRLARSFDDMTSILYNDGYGVFKFEHRVMGGPKSPELVLGINTVGPYIDVYAGKLTKTYPQSAFTVAELRALHEKNPDELSGKEYNAIADYKNACDIGISELFPEDERRYIQMGYERTCTPIVQGGVVVTTPVDDVKMSSLPAGMWNFPAEWDGSIYS